MNRHQRRAREKLQRKLEQTQAAIERLGQQRDSLDYRRASLKAKAPATRDRNRSTRK